MFTCVLLVLAPVLQAQGVAVNSDGSLPDNSAVLDIKSASKGVLLPRLTLVQRNQIASPATGLLIYQTDEQPGLYYFNGSTWLPIMAGPVTRSWDFRFTQPNGNGFETTSNFWIRSATFLYRGTLLDGVPSSAVALCYTTNASTWYRVRIQDVTNNVTIALSQPVNQGTIAMVNALNLGSFNNLPANSAIFEVQLLATDASGNTGISGRQATGIQTFQMWR
jgi:hypothetical protein